jgi:hypothetical protein
MWTIIVVAIIVATTILSAITCLHREIKINLLLSFETEAGGSLIEITAGVILTTISRTDVSVGRESTAAGMSSGVCAAKSVNII